MMKNMYKRIDTAYDDIPFRCLVVRHGVDLCDEWTELHMAEHMRLDDTVAVGLSTLAGGEARGYVYGSGGVRA
jgi:hypothetical protein